MFNTSEWEKVELQEDEHGGYHRGIQWTDEYENEYTEHLAFFTWYDEPVPYDNGDFMAMGECGDVLIETREDDDRTLYGRLRAEGLTSE